MRTSALTTSTLITTLLFAGCGGGGSSSSPAATTPVAVAPVSPVTPTPPTTPATAVQAASLQAAAVSNYTVGSNAESMFKSVNALRASMGLGPLVQNANVDIAVKNHANYVQTNQSGADPHGEVTGKPGFTGASVLDRVTAAGYAATTASEVIGFSPTWPSTTYNSVDTLASVLYHRNVMTLQGMTAIGVSGEDQANAGFIDIAAIKQQVNAGDYVGVYPVDQQANVWLTHGVESPNPFYQEFDMTLANVCTKTSYPVSLASEASTTLAVTSFTITEDGQTTPLDLRLFTKATSAQDAAYLGANVAFVVGKAPFKKSTKYNVHFIGTATGAATGSTTGLKIDKSWSFTTGTYTHGC